MVKLYDLALVAVGSAATLLGFIAAVWVVTGRTLWKRNKPTGVVPPPSFFGSPQEDAAKAAEALKWLSPEFRQPNFHVEPVPVDPRLDVPMPDFDQRLIREQELKHRGAPRG